MVFLVLHSRVGKDTMNLQYNNKVSVLEIHFPFKYLQINTEQPSYFYVRL